MQNIPDFSIYFCWCYLYSEIQPRKRPVCKGFPMLFCHGIQEVSGSIPLISTKKTWNRKISGLFSSEICRFCPFCVIFSKYRGTLAPRGTFSTGISTGMTLSHNGRIIMLSNVRELDDPAGRFIRTVRVAVACWKGFAEPVNGIHPNTFLNV